LRNSPHRSYKISIKKGPGAQREGIKGARELGRIKGDGATKNKGFFRVLSSFIVGVQFLWDYVMCVACCVFRVACCVLRVACFVLRVACCVLRVSCCVFRVACVLRACCVLPIMRVACAYYYACCLLWLRAT
jgi:hypothetical protein